MRNTLARIEADTSYAGRMCGRREIACGFLMLFAWATFLSGGCISGHTGGGSSSGAGNHNNFAGTHPTAPNGANEGQPGASKSAASASPKPVDAFMIVCSPLEVIGAANHVVPIDAGSAGEDGRFPFTGDQGPYKQLVEATIGRLVSELGATKRQANPDSIVAKWMKPYRGTGGKSVSKSKVNKIAQLLRDSAKSRASSANAKLRGKQDSKQQTRLADLERCAKKVARKIPVTDRRPAMKKVLAKRLYQAASSMPKSGTSAVKLASGTIKAGELGRRVRFTASPVLTVVRDPDIWGKSPRKKALDAIKTFGGKLRKRVESIDGASDVSFDFSASEVDVKGKPAFRVTYTVSLDIAFGEGPTAGVDLSGDEVRISMSNASAKAISSVASAYRKCKVTNEIFRQDGSELAIAVPGTTADYLVVGKASITGSTATVSVSCRRGTGRCAKLQGDIADQLVAFGNSLEGKHPSLVKGLKVDCSPVQSSGVAAGARCRIRLRSAGAGPCVVMEPCGNTGTCWDFQVRKGKDCDKMRMKFYGVGVEGVSYLEKQLLDAVDSGDVSLGGADCISQQAQGRCQLSFSVDDSPSAAGEGLGVWSEEAVASVRRELLKFNIGIETGAKKTVVHRGGDLLLAATEIKTARKRGCPQKSLVFWEGSGQGFGINGSRGVPGLKDNGYSPPHYVFLRCQEGKLELGLIWEREEKATQRKRCWLVRQNDESFD